LANPNKAKGRIYSKQTHQGLNFRIVSMILLIFLDHFLEEVKGLQERASKVECGRGLAIAALDVENFN
jgi:hypothetical protein